MIQAEIGAASCNAEGAFPAKGLRIRGFELWNTDGKLVHLADFRGKCNLVLFFLGTPDETSSELARSIAERSAELVARDAKVLLAFMAPSKKLTTLERSTPIVVLTDPDGAIHRDVGAVDENGQPAQACYITDKFGEVFALFRTRDGNVMPSVDEILGWLDFIEAQCPECEAPEWPVDAA